MCCDRHRRQPHLWPTTPCGLRGQTPRPDRDLCGVSFGVTPRQTCPRPDGLGRNLRSKTRWFTGFCNSHQVSHFATFFIDARAEISVAESHVSLHSIAARGTSSKPVVTPGKAILVFLDAIQRRGFFWAPVPLEEGWWPRPRHRCKPHESVAWMTCSRSVLVRVTTMILPQVHLRKPCYDFSFL